MPNEPKYRTKSLVSNSPKRYGKASWIGLGVLLTLGFLVWLAGLQQERQAQFSAFEAGKRNAKFAATVKDPERAINIWKKATASMRGIEKGHPKYDDAQVAIAEYEKEIAAVREEASAQRDAEKQAASAEAQELAEAYEILLRQLDPNGLNVADVAIDPNIDNQIIISVGPNWNSASKTTRLDVAQSLWKGWGKVCECSTPRIKFKSQAERDLGGTGVWGTAIELKD